MRVDSFRVPACTGTPSEDGSEGCKTKGLQFEQGAALLWAMEKGWEGLARDSDDDRLWQHVVEGSEKSWVQVYREWGAAFGTTCVLIFPHGDLNRTQLGELKECMRQQGELHIFTGVQKNVVGTSLG